MLIMSSTNFHTKRPVRTDDDEDEEEDLIDNAIKKTGCSTQHNALQDCYYDSKDWRKCTEQVKAFKECMIRYNNSKKKSA